MVPHDRPPPLLSPLLLLQVGGVWPLWSPIRHATPEKSFGAFPFFYSLSRHAVHSLAPIIAEHQPRSPCSACRWRLVPARGSSLWQRLHRALPPLDSTQARGAIAIACLSIFCFRLYRRLKLRLPAYLSDWCACLAGRGHRQGHPADPYRHAFLLVAPLWKPFLALHCRRIARRTRLSHEHHLAWQRLIFS